MIKTKNYTLVLSEEEKDYLMNLVQKEDSKDEKFVYTGLQTRLKMLNPDVTPWNSEMSSMFDTLKEMYTVPKNVVLDVNEVPLGMTKEEVINVFRKENVLYLKSYGNKPLNSYIAGCLKN